MDEPIAQESGRIHLEIDVVTADQVNFASHQNSVPLIRYLTIKNSGLDDITGLTLSLEASPGFLTPKRWDFDAITAGSEVKIKDRHVALNGQLLMELAEAVSGEATFTLRQGETELVQRINPVRVLARNEWGGSTSMPELIAAFSQPNDPAIDKILAKAAIILEAAIPDAKLDGYASGKRKYVWATAAAIWAAIASYRLKYSVPPASFETTGQKIRTPSMILEGGIATCLDTTLLFCSALEQAGLRPIIVIMKGHAFAGVWLQPEHFSVTVTEDVTALRKRISLQELLVFETTLVTQERAPLFKVAVEQGEARLIVEHEENFIHAIDIQRARDQKIRPLSFPTQASGTSDIDDRDETAPIHEQSPDLPDFTIKPAAPDLTSLSPKDRLDAWQRRLLDLSARNALLNHRTGPSSLNLLCQDCGAIEDIIAQGAPLYIKPLPTQAERDGEIHQRETGQELEKQLLEAGLERHEVYCKATKEDVERKLIELYRKARSDLEEGGANTLFVAIGFLVWKRQDSDKKYRAPLLLVPVELKRRSARTLPFIQSHDEETRFNPTLIEMLRQDFGINLPELQTELPHDASGVDVRQIFNTVRAKIKDIEGFDVVEDIFLGTFSFAKYLMWKDLVDRTDKLRASPVVKHLLDSPRDQYERLGVFPDPSELDRIKSPKDLFLPLDYDSSQASAIVASAEGRDFVLIGPPGTGKSQSIANMIAHNMALGRKVLFVAEKRAALDVVYRRLDQVGLAPFCLELHSNKAKKRDVLNQLNRAWDTAEANTQDEWEREAVRLKAVRDKLNIYVEALHREHRNGLSVHQAIGIEASYGRVPEIKFSFESTDVHDQDDLAHLRAAAHRMDVEAKTLGDIANHPLNRIRNGDWSNSWQIQLVGAARALLAATTRTKDAFAKALEILGIPHDAMDPEKVEGVNVLAESLLIGAKYHIPWCLGPDGADLIDKTSEACGLLDDYRTTEKRLSVRYRPEPWRNIDLISLKARWQIGQLAWWPKGYFVRRAVTKNLQASGGTVSTPDPAADFRVLDALAQSGAKIDSLTMRLAPVRSWEGYATETPRTRDTAAAAKKVRSALFGLVGGSANADTTIKRITALLEGGEDILGRQAGVGRALAGFIEAYAELSECIRTYNGLAGDNVIAGVNVSADYFEYLKSIAKTVIDNEITVNQWCSWLRARNEAMTLGLTPLIQAIENGDVLVGVFEKTFDAAYCRWWASRKIDEDEPLRLFSVNQHEDQIAQFKALDERVRELTAQYIKAQLCKAIPHKNQVKGIPHFAILSREIQKQARNIAVRELFTQASDILPVLAPCVLMSPLSVAQYLPADLKLFDLVIFDEASQITVWDAIGAIARGNQTVVAGDPNQMPPTNFFTRDQSPLGDDSDVEEDADSILDEMAAAGIPRRILTWHYRSQSEGLIAFSNSKYYDGSLITFAAPNTKDQSVRLQYVENGIYLRGKDQTNQREAKEVVAYAVKLLRDPEFNRKKLSLGIVSFNIKQQTLIQNLLDSACKAYPDIEHHFSDDNPESVFIKNLESVQGDERDVILFSITFGKDEAGAMAMTFGPLNQSGGWRRLNVAITRARREMVVFASIKAEDIDLSRTQAEGVQGLKEFLDYAERGVVALGTGASGPRGDYDSPFEASVANALRERGWSVHTQVGVGPFRIDLAIVHPEKPGRYLAAVECDGATYHRSATARDRDIVRQGVLERIGWQILRIWSTDYWVNSVLVLDRVHKQLQSLLAQAHENISVEPDTAQSLASSNQKPVADVPLISETEAPPPVSFTLVEPAAASNDAGEVIREPRQEALVALAPNAIKSGYAVYRITTAADLSIAPDPECFYDNAYTETLKSIIENVLKIEAPIHEDLLAIRIGRLHGFARTGNQITSRVTKIARKLGQTTKEKVGTFYWMRDFFPDEHTLARRPANEDGKRSVEHICQQEIAAFLRLTLDENDPIVSAAREMGLMRLAAVSRARLETVMKLIFPSDE